MWCAVNVQHVLMEVVVAVDRLDEWLDEYDNIEVEEAGAWEEDDDVLA